MPMPARFPTGVVGLLKLKLLLPAAVSGLVVLPLLSLRRRGPWPRPGKNNDGTLRIPVNVDVRLPPSLDDGRVEFVKGGGGGTKVGSSSPMPRMLAALRGIPFASDIEGRGGVNPYMSISE